MATKPLTPPTPADVKQVILDESDFAHEMRVGQVYTTILKGHNSANASEPRMERPLHSGCYRDYATNKMRQFDYQCEIIGDFDSPNQKKVFLAVECKNIPETCPLVIFCVRRTEPTYYTYVESNRANSVVRRVDMPNWIYNEPFVGKKCARIKWRDDGFTIDSQAGEKEVFERYAQALSSAFDLARRSCSFARATHKEVISSLILPLIVLPDRSLWRVDHDGAGSIVGEPVLVEQCSYFVDWRFNAGELAHLNQNDFAFTHVQFLTLQGFGAFVAKFSRSRAFWQTIFPPP